jgi:sulfite reductase (NADPH) flavoprotein alpha-component
MSTEATSQFNRKNPFPGTLRVNRRLTFEGSGKDTRHYEIDLAGSGLAYEVGDSLGVFPCNDLALVDEIIGLLGCEPDAQVPGNDGTPKTLRDALMFDYQITQPDKKLLKAIADKVPEASSLLEFMDPAVKPKLDEYLWGREVIDFLLHYPGAKFTPEEFVATLRKLQPRLYSIASSQRAFPNEVHLTIATVEYESHGRARKGVCSSFLAQRCGADGKVPVFVHTAKHFRVPEDLSIPIIMVGPGTGIAPFRAFLQERKATGATGKNWLFFGEQHAATDFFYNDEWNSFIADGTLSKLTTAFSRDQEQKIYVQHRLKENGAEFWDWLQNGGAYFYVCGDASRMAKDVENALIEIAQEHGGKSADDAKAWVEELKHAKRYRKDVY